MSSRGLKKGFSGAGRRCWQVREPNYGIVPNQGQGCRISRRGFQIAHPEVADGGFHQCSSQCFGHRFPSGPGLKLLTLSLRRIPVPQSLQKCGHVHIWTDSLQVNSDRNATRHSYYGPVTRMGQIELKPGMPVERRFSMPAQRESDTGCRNAGTTRKNHPE